MMTEDNPLIGLLFRYVVTISMRERSGVTLGEQGTGWGTIGYEATVVVERDGTRLSGNRFGATREGAVNAATLDVWEQAEALRRLAMRPKGDLR